MSPSTGHRVPESNLQINCPFGSWDPAPLGIIAARGATSTLRKTRPGARLKFCTGFLELGLTLCESECDALGKGLMKGATMDDREGFLSSTLKALGDAAKASVEVAKAAQEVVTDAAKATVEAGKEMISTAPSAVSEAVASTSEKPRKARRTRDSNKKRASTAARPRKAIRKSAAKKTHSQRPASAGKDLYESAQEFVRKIAKRFKAQPPSSRSLYVPPGDRSMSRSALEP